MDLIMGKFQPQDEEPKFYRLPRPTKQPEVQGSSTQATMPENDVRLISETKDKE